VNKEGPEPRSGILALCMPDETVAVATDIVVLKVARCT
jgi:hypothetical protein